MNPFRDKVIAPLDVEIFESNDKIPSSEINLGIKVLGVGIDGGFKKGENKELWSHRFISKGSEVIINKKYVTIISKEIYLEFYNLQPPYVIYNKYKKQFVENISSVKHINFNFFDKKFFEEKMFTLSNCESLWSDEICTSLFKKLLSCDQKENDISEDVLLQIFRGTKLTPVIRNIQEPLCVINDHQCEFYINDLYLDEWTRRKSVVMSISNLEIKEKIRDDYYICGLNGVTQLIINNYEKRFLKSPISVIIIIYTQFESKDKLEIMNYLSTHNSSVDSYEIVNKDQLRVAKIISHDDMKILK